MFNVCVFDVCVSNVCVFDVCVFNICVFNICVFNICVLLLGVHMFLYESSPPILESIEVFGILEVESDPIKTFTIKTKYLYVSGALIAGTEEVEFEGELTIILDGDITTPDYEIVNPPISDGIEMGSKAIGKCLIINNQ